MTAEQTANSSDAGDGRRTLELWLVDLTRAAPVLEQLERELPRLGAAERGAILAHTHALERQRRFSAHVALRVLIERVAGDSARGKDLARPAGGKPRVQGPAADVAFSLAHAEDWALIGVARGSEIGVDLEAVRSVALAPLRRQRILRAAAALSPMPLIETPADAAFIQAWVRLEALAKASGEGLARTLTVLGVWHASAPHADVATLARRHLSRTGLSVHDLIGTGSMAAIAIDSGLRPPTPRAFPLDRAGIEALIGGAAA
jgi:4'-phosphopantetheinyl transferase